jgi:hypothetical protein
MRIGRSKMTLKVAKPKVVYLDNATSLDIPTDRVLNAALNAQLQDVVILGKHPDGEYYFASSVADGGTVLWMWEKLKAKLMEI